MSEIRRYVVVDRDDNEEDFEYESFEDAKSSASRSGGAVICRTYVYDDHELVWTPDGSSSWPPETID